MAGIFAQVLTKFLTNTYIFTAIGAVFLYAESCYHLNIDIFRIYDQFLFIFCATLGLYNFIQLLPFKSKAFSFLHAAIALPALAYCGWFLSHEDIPVLLYVGHLALMGAAYSLPILGKPLREIPFLKIFVIIYVWSAATVVIPIRLNWWNSDVFYPVLVSRIIFVTMIALAFDIVHQPEDASKGLITFPTVFGEKVKYVAFPLGLLGIFYSILISVQYGVIMAVADFGVTILLFQAHSLRRGKLFPLTLDLMLCLKFALLYLSETVLA